MEGGASVSVTPPGPSGLSSSSLQITGLGFSFSSLSSHGPKLQIYMFTQAHRSIWKQKVRKSQEARKHSSSRKTNASQSTSRDFSLCLISLDWVKGNGDNGYHPTTVLGSRCRQQGRQDGNIHTYTHLPQPEWKKNSKRCWNLFIPSATSIRAL